MVSRSSLEIRRLVVVGQGYVGLPMALRAAEAGLSVIGLDTNEEIVCALNEGRSHVDDVSDAQLREGLREGFRASSDPDCLANADAILVCVPTPLGASGGPDLDAVIAAARAIGSRVKPNALVVLESTTYPGTTEEVFAPLVAGTRYTIGEDIFIAFSPERIDPGNKKYGVENTPKVVGGLTRACTEAAKQLYSNLVDTVVAAKTAKEAEMAKLLENTFRHVNIALVNEMLRFSQELGIDLWDAIECAATKPFGFMPFRPGPGVGGHCIPVDPTYLSHRVKASLGYAFRMVELAEEINKAAPLYVAERVWQALNDAKVAVNGATVLLLGITYKPDVSDCRESPAEPLRERLERWGANVMFHDPLVEAWPTIHHDGPARLTSALDVYEAAATADITVLLQAHSYYDLRCLATCARLLLDTRGAVGDFPGIIPL